MLGVTRVAMHMGTGEVNAEGNQGSLTSHLGMEQKYFWLLHATETGGKHQPDGPFGLYSDLVLGF